MRNTFIKLRVDSFDFELFKSAMKGYKKSNPCVDIDDKEMFVYYLSIVSAMAKCKPNDKSVKDIVESNPGKFPINSNVFISQIEYVLEKNKITKNGHMVNVTHTQVVTKEITPECKSAIHIVYDEFKANFKKKMEFDPPWGPRDWACAKYLLLKFDIESIKSMITIFFEKADRNTLREGFPFVGGYNSFYSKSNSLYADIKSPERNMQKNFSSYKDMTISRYQESLELEKLRNTANVMTNCERKGIQ